MKISCLSNNNYYNFFSDSVSAVVIIGCDTPRIENLVRGSRGGRIRRIAIEAEQSLSDAFLTNFYLRLVVCGKQL